MGNNLPYNLSAGSFFIVILLACSILSAWADSSQREEPFYTNKDVERYKNPSDNRPPDAKKSVMENRTDSKKSLKERRLQEDWCDRASVCNREIDDEKETVKEIEHELLSAKGRDNHKKVAALQRKLENSKKRLKKAEGNLNALENEAHRKGIPPGWLRCRFD
jgi:hypothetical protein